MERFFVCFALVLFCCGCVVSEEPVGGSFEQGFAEEVLFDEFTSTVATMRGTGVLGVEYCSLFSAEDTYFPTRMSFKINNRGTSGRLGIRANFSEVAGESSPGGVVFSCGFSDSDWWANCSSGGQNILSAGESYWACAVVLSGEVVYEFSQGPRASSHVQRLTRGGWERLSYSGGRSLAFRVWGVNASD